MAEIWNLSLSSPHVTGVQFFRIMTCLQSGNRLYSTKWNESEMYSAKWNESEMYSTKWNESESSKKIQLLTSLFSDATLIITQNHEDARQQVKSTRTSVF